MKNEKSIENRAKESQDMLDKIEKTGLIGVTDHDSHWIGFLQGYVEGIEFALREERGESHVDAIQAKYFGEGVDRGDQL